jgi:aminocarboxymuconate-semialdehyde decarboxylase
MNLTIDTHHHMLPDFFYQETNDVHALAGGLAPMAWTKETSLSFMDDAGIDVAVLSVSTPWGQYRRWAECQAAESGESENRNM